jgi:hypothetical protein
MRMQLKRGAFGRRAFGLWAKALVALVTLAFVSSVRADAGQADLYSTLFYEFGGPLNMMVITPRANLRIDPIEELSIRASWEADIVSGASVAVVDAPSSEVDAITSATQLEDFRNVFTGAVDLRSSVGALRASYTYGFENDYRSHSFTVGARTDLFERNSTFDLSYARGFDQLCDRFQPTDQEPVTRQRLDTAEGCFEDPLQRTTHDIDLQTFQGSWTQAWAPVFVTQVTVTGQLVDGFQSNPYRAVWLGRSAAQEHHPTNRFRYAGSLAGRLWLEPLNGALSLSGRAYRDNWDVRSITAEVGYEQSIEGSVRLRVRGRYYRQGAAAFYSDDYSLMPRGQYFTGDRELGDMETFLVGAQLTWTLTAGTEGASLGFLQSFKLVLKGDYIHHEFGNFRYGRAGVPNNNSIIVTLGLEMVF